MYLRIRDGTAVHYLRGTIQIYTSQSATLYKLRDLAHYHHMIANSSKVYQIGAHGSLVF